MAKSYFAFKQNVEFGHTPWVIKMIIVDYEEPMLVHLRKAMNMCASYYYDPDNAIDYLQNKFQELGIEYEDMEVLGYGEAKQFRSY